MMTPERWRQIEQVLQAALESEPAERGALLERECAGDPGLRREVESLLASAELSRSFLGSHALEDATGLLDDEDADPVLGRDIGHYFVESLLGAGGMGTVYLARDLTLGRKVALKLLDPVLAGDAHSHARFLREARLAASLDHPNICTIHEVGESEGRPFIAMQYVEGETLKSVIGGRPLKLDRLLSIITQIGDALSAAHARGVVHRDIKANNIIVTPEGRAKVLDFGIAKLLEKGRAEVEVTLTGQVLGTPSAMSPEQARGLAVDARTDVWSLGVVLYEMLTGRAPFAGETVSDVIALVLQGEPPPISHHAPEAPAALQQIVNKAMRKNPNERHQTVAEMLDDLREVKREAEVRDLIESSTAGDRHSERATAIGDEEGGTISAGVAAPTVGETNVRTASSAEYLIGAVKRHRAGAALVVVAAALLFAFTLIGVGLYRFANRDDSRQTAQTSAPFAPFQTMTFTPVTSTGKAAAAVISPDGKYVAYVLDEGGQQGLWTRHVVTPSDVEVIAPAEVQYQGLTFSPDGSYIFCVMRKPGEPAATLYRVPVLGGSPPRKLLVGVDSPVTFSPDGGRIAFVRNYSGERFGVLMVADADGNREQQLAPDKGPDSDRFFFHPGGPAWSPDGRVIACAAGIVDSAGSSMNVAEVSIADGTIRPISSERWWNVGRVAWFSDGSGLVMAAQEQQSTWDQIWRVSYPGGETRRITNDLDRYLGVSLSADSDALVTVQVDQVSNVWIAPGGDARLAQPITFGKLNYYNLSWTPDGRIVYQSNASGRLDIWIMGADGKNQKQLTVDGDNNFYPTVSPDGRYVVFTSNRGDGISIWRMGIDGGDLKQLTAAGSSFSHPSPDGRWAVYTSYNFSTPTLWKVAMDGGEPAQLTDKYSSMPAVSPDGTSIACLYRDEPTAPTKVAVIPFEGGQPVRVFDLPIGSGILRWTPDGRAVAYVETRGGVSNLWGQPVGGGVPKQLTDFTADQIFGFAWSRDGEQLAIARGDVTRDVILLRGFR